VNLVFTKANLVSVAKRQQERVKKQDLRYANSSGLRTYIQAQASNNFVVSLARIRVVHCPWL